MSADTNSVVRGATIMLRSGRYFDLQSPESCVFDIDDIAHGLSNICRFTGQCKEFYSVAQHSVLVSHVIPQEYALQGLLHDAAEALIGDVTTPLKIMLPDYRRVEHRVEQAVFSRFGLPAVLHPSVKHGDRVLLRTEQRDLMNAGEDTWAFTGGVAPLPQRIVALQPREAKAAFLQRFLELTEGANKVGAEAQAA